MIAVRLPTAMVLAVLLTGSAFADDQQRLESRGYEPIWQGYAAIKTCVHRKDYYQLGGFVFVCDQYSYEYPYHYGTATLLALPSQSNGYLCLDDVDDCIEGTVLSK